MAVFALLVVRSSNPANMSVCDTRHKAVTAMVKACHVRVLYFLGFSHPGNAMTLCTMNMKLGLCKTRSLRAISAASQQQEGDFSFGSYSWHYFSLSVCH